MQIRPGISRRTLLGTLSTAAIALLSAACGSAASPTATTAPAKPAEAPKAAEAPKPTEPAPAAAKPAVASGQQVQIRWQSPYPNDKAKPEIDQLIQKYEQDHPNVKIMPEAKLDWDKLMATFVAKTAADVVWGCCHFIANFITQGVAEDLTGYVKDWPDTKDFIPAQYNWYNRKGHQYAIPVYCATHLFQYNKRLFDEMKVPYPKDDWSWNDFRQMSKTLTKRSGDRTEWYGYDGAYDINWDLPSLLWANGENLYDEDNNAHITLDSPKAMDLLQWYADIRWQDKSSPVPADEKAYTTLGFSTFQSAKAALSYRCSWFIFFMTQVMKDPFDFVAPPKGPDGKRRSWITSDAMIMFTASKAKDEAFKVMQFGSSTEMESSYLRANNGMLQPARLSLVDKWLQSVREGLAQTYPQAAEANFDAWKKAYDYSPTSQPHFADHALAMDYLQPVWDQIYKTGTAKAKDVLPAAVKEANDKLKSVPSTIVK